MPEAISSRSKTAGTNLWSRCLCTVYSTMLTVLRCPWPSQVRRWYWGKEGSHRVRSEAVLLGPSIKSRRLQEETGENQQWSMLSLPRHCWPDLQEKACGGAARAVQDGVCQL